MVFGGPQQRTSQRPALAMAIVAQDQAGAFCGLGMADVQAAPQDQYWGPSPNSRTLRATVRV